jgi:hypothetical protein
MRLHGVSRLAALLPIVTTMSARINYDDNLFYVSQWLKQLRAANRLDIDSDIFLHKIVEDILFIHEVLRKMSLNLQKNDSFIHRLEFLRMLVLTKKEFVQFLEELQVTTSAFAENLIPFHDQFMQCRNIHYEDIQNITDILENEAGFDKDESDIISSDEYRFLFKPDGESDIV